MTPKDASLESLDDKALTDGTNPKDSSLESTNKVLR